MTIEKLILTGGSGTLGTELIRISSDYDVEFISPGSVECDITSESSIDLLFLKHPECRTVIHCAAETDVKSIECNPSRACKVNISGTLNLVDMCRKYDKKIVFISTEHVFDGDKGLYTTSDKINPLSHYAKTKAAGELIVSMYEQSLIIRTSFFGYSFPYERAFVDQWSSKDYVDIVGPKIMKCIRSGNTGIVHTGSQRRTIYDIAILRKPSVGKMYLKDAKFSPIPVDTSLSFI